MRQQRYLTKRQSFTFWKGWLVAIGLFTAAVAIRFYYLGEVRASAVLRTPSPDLDLNLHWQAARVIRAVVEVPFNFELQLPSAPGYPLLLSLTQTVLGESLDLHRILFALMGSLSVLLVFAIARFLSGSIFAAAVSAFCFGFMPSSVYFDLSLQKVTWEVFLLLCALIPTLALSYGGSPGFRSFLAFLASLFFGLLVLSQQSYLLVVVLVGGAMFYFPYRMAKRVRFALYTSIIPVLVFLAVSSPGLLFPKAEHYYLPQQGIHVRIGFNPGATGAY